MAALQYSCLEESPGQRKPWQATIHGMANSQTQPSMHAHPHLTSATLGTHKQSGGTGRPQAQQRQDPGGLPLYPAGGLRGQRQGPTPQENILLLPAAAPQSTWHHLPVAFGLAWLQRARRAVCSRQVRTVPSQCGPSALPSIHTYYLQGLHLPVQQALMSPPPSPPASQGSFSPAHLKQIPVVLVDLEGSKSLG